VAIEVPYAAELLKRVAFDTIYHEHLSYYFVRTSSRCSSVTGCGS